MLHTAPDYYSAASIYRTIEQAEGIVARSEGRIIEELPDYFLGVAYCESRLLHERNGKITKSPTKDYGLLQINYRWIPTAEKLGYDIFDKEGNIKFAKWLYEKDGLSHWSASKNCWLPLQQLSVR